MSSNLYTPRIIALFYLEIANKFNHQYADEFLKLLKVWEHPVEFENELSDGEEVNFLNNFLRMHLNHLQNTTELRSWLVPTDNIEDYLLVFRNSWSHSLISSGIFNYDD